MLYARTIGNILFDIWRTNCFYFHSSLNDKQKFIFITTNIDVVKNLALFIFNSFKIRDSIVCVCVRVVCVCACVCVLCPKNSERYVTFGR